MARGHSSAKVTVIVGILMLAACGGRPPPPVRGVIETNVSSWNFRRYQQVLDAEVWVAKNTSVAHTASYVRRKALKRGRIGAGDIVNAFVTRYEQDAGVLRAMAVFVRRLAQESGYVVDVRSLGGARVVSVAGHGETWVLWTARGHIVKIGGRGVENVPSTLVEAYAEIYPSRVPSGILEGPLPAAPERKSDDEKPEKTPTYDPDNPSPDWQK